MVLTLKCSPLEKLFWQNLQSKPVYFLGVGAEVGVGVAVVVDCLGDSMMTGIGVWLIVWLIVWLRCWLWLASLELWGYLSIGCFSVAIGQLTCKEGSIEWLALLGMVGDAALINYLENTSPNDVSLLGYLGDWGISIYAQGIPKCILGLRTYYIALPCLTLPCLHLSPAKNPRTNFRHRLDKTSTGGSKIASHWPWWPFWPMCRKDLPTRP